jgi:hypothetical protein
MNSSKGTRTRGGNNGGTRDWGVLMVKFHGERGRIVA